MCACIHVGYDALAQAFVCVYICAYLSTYLYAHTYTFFRLILVYMYIRTSMCSYCYVYVCTDVYTHKLFIYIHSPVRARVCVCDAFVCMKTCMHMLVYVRRTHTHARTHMRAHSSCCKVQRRLNKSITPWLCTTFVVALLTSKRRTASYGQPIALGYLCDYRKPFILLH